MSELQILLLSFIVFISTTALLNIYTKGKQISLSGKLKIQIAIGEVLVFVGKEHKAFKPKPLGKGVSFGLRASIFIGIVLFYLVFVPGMIRFIKDFISYSTGVATEAPAPVVIPIPLLFKFTNLLPYLLIAISVAVIIHELAHAIVALREGVSVRSWGIGMVFLIPVAFVELKDEEFNIATPNAKLNILSAGIFANALSSIVFWVITIAILLATPQILGTPVQTVTITGIDCSICNTTLCPAQVAGLETDTIIKSINSTRIESAYHLQLVLKNVSIGSNIIMHTCNYAGECRNISLLLSAGRRENPLQPCIGIRFDDATVFVRNSRMFAIPWFEKVLLTLDMLFVINLSLFVINAIPIFITDGSLFLRQIPFRHVFINKMISLKIVDIINTLIIAVAGALSAYLLLTG